MQNLLDIDYRKQIIDEILGDENRRRKDVAFRRCEIYNKKQAPYIEAALKAEFPTTWKQMRKVTSINIAPRIINETACVYKDAPTRQFAGADGVELSADQTAQLKNLYALAKVDERLNRANRIRRFQNQTILQIVPKADRFEMRAYHPHQIDAIPMEDDPHEAFGYVISDYQYRFQRGDGLNQAIADANDNQKQEQRKTMRVVFWSAEHNMTCDGYGNIMQEDPTDIENALGELPFYDLSAEKEGEFWVNLGSNTIDFAIDFALMLSDTANTSRLQSYAQGVWYGVEKPEAMEIGPNKVLFVAQDPNSTVQPKFEFVTPNPDLTASMDLLDRTLNIHLTSENVDPKILNSKGDARTYTSGFERLLAMYEKFDASKDDLKAFAHVEEWAFRILAKWSNLYQNTIDNPLSEDLQLAKIPDGSKCVTQFAKPEFIQTKSEQEDSSLKLYEAGVKSVVQVVMELYAVSEERAIEMLDQMITYKNQFKALTPIAAPADVAALQVDSTDLEKGRIAA